MHPIMSFVAILFAVLLVSPVRGGGRKPAPPPSRFFVTLQFDLNSLPKGVKVKQVPAQNWISNTGDVPLVLNEMFQNDMLVGGTKLVAGKVYHYFPNGIPMEGKTHLKGWQILSEDLKEAPLFLTKQPSRIYADQVPGGSKELPPPEPFAITVKYDGKPWEIKGTVHYHVNPEFKEPPDSGGAKEK